MGEITFASSVHPGMDEFSRGSRKTQDINPMMVQSWSIVYGSGPTLNKLWINVFAWLPRAGEWQGNNFNTCEQLLHACFRVIQARAS